MVKRRAGPADVERTLDALTREIQRLQEHSAKLSADLEELRQHLSHLYVNLAPLDPRLKTAKPRKPRKPRKSR